jgi:DNA-binding CsgD family transcriptional regulator
MSLERFHRDLDALSALTSFGDLEKTLRKHSDSLGFSSFIYALRVPVSFAEARMVVVKGYPDAWLERYFTLAFHESDPVLALARTRVTPFTWQDATAGTLTEPSQRVMDEATDFGLRTGVSMPVHTARGELGILSLASEDKDTEKAARARPYVQLLAGYLHEALHRVLDVTEQPAHAPLTERELECLRWAADGKTSWEISILLATAERTVNFHLNNAARKLGVVNRQHAVAKAVMLGLLRPRPF